MTTFKKDAYHMLRDAGYTSKDADKICRKSWEIIQKALADKKQTWRSYKYGLTARDIELIEAMTLT